jgi:O-antigen/teichoic acid export membrane protein
MSKNLSEIRVTYSGLISLAAGLVGIVTGFVYTLIITRSLSQEEFGTLSLINGLFAYLFIIEPIISFWTTREIARGENSGKTAVVTNSMFSVGAIPLYLLIVFLVTNQADVNEEILIFAALMVPFKFLKHTLASINLGHKPHVTSFALITFEITKVVVVLILVYLFDMGLKGVIITLTISYIAHFLYSLYGSFEKIRVKFSLDYLKKWLRLCWLPLYPKIAETLLYSDVVIFTIIMGKVDALAYWAASLVIAEIVLNASHVNKAIYPKLLGGGVKEHLQDNLVRVFYFSFPLAALSISLAKPILFALNPIYQIAVPVVILLTLVYFLRSFSNVLYISLKGLDKVDTKKSTFSEYLKSGLFVVPTIRIISFGSYLGVLAVTLLLMRPLVHTDLDLIVYWALLALLTQIPLTVYLYYRTLKEFKPKIAVKPIIKYFVASIVSFGVTYFLIEKFVDYDTSIFNFLPSLLIMILVGMILYISLTYLVDLKTRKLIKAIIKETKGFTSR